MENFTDFVLTCPLPLEQYPQVLMAHGGGGKLMNQLISQMFAPTFQTTWHQSTLSQVIQHDAVALNLPTNKIAFTTDSYVIKPLFFPGGNIGSLAVYGTVNDLAMSGARPLYLSVGFIIEEGLPMETLWQVVQAMQKAAQETGVQIITGDTKVVDRGKGDGIFINTAGIGIIEHDQIIAPPAVQVGDRLLLSGDIGRHGIAVMAQRSGLELETVITSDCAPLLNTVQALLTAGVKIHCLRDLTRGGLASAVNEIATVAGVDIHLEEGAISVREDVQGACEILGFDPLYVANEGRFIAFVPADHADQALTILQKFNPDQNASIIGEVVSHSQSKSGLVTMTSQIGTSRIVDMLSGEQLPRIC